MLNRSFVSSVRAIPISVLVGACLSVFAASAAIAGTPTPTPSAKPTKKPAAAPAQYECQKCHMRYSAADAKKDHYVDPMDGGKLTLVKAAAKASPSPKPTKMKM